MDTLSPAAKDIVERQDKNGILVFRLTNSPINLLSLPQMSANGWDISMRDCTLYHPEDKHCIQLDVIDNLFHIRILHNYAAADPIHSITIHH
ncbi:hypothetical protein NFJ02_02g74950 [Pycnococcus provasolii]